MKRSLFFLLMFSLLPSSSFGGELISGDYCHTCKEGESVEECRHLVRSMALRDAIESSQAYQEAAGTAHDFDFKNDLIQIISSGYLENIQVLDHQEAGLRICETIQAEISPEVDGRILKKKLNDITKRVEEYGVANNGCLKILQAMKPKEDRYGYRIEIIAKVLKRTGSLFEPFERNKRPCFKVCVDYFDEDGLPVGGDSKFVHESDVEMLPGEIRKLLFYPPQGMKSYKIWLGQSSFKKKVPSKSYSGKKSRPLLTKKSAAPSANAESGERVLYDITTGNLNGGLNVMLNAGTPIKNHRKFFMDSPPRLVIDLPGKWKYRGKNVMEIANGIVQKIRVGLHPDKLRVVIDIRGENPTIPVSIIQSSEKALIITFQDKL